MPSVGAGVFRELAVCQAAILCLLKGAVHVLSGYPMSAPVPGGHTMSPEGPLKGEAFLEAVSLQVELTYICVFHTCQWPSGVPVSL